MENMKNYKYHDYIPEEYNISNNNTKDSHINNYITIGVKAPNFTSISTHGECSLSDYKGKWCILFSHPR